MMWRSILAEKIDVFESRKNEAPYQEILILGWLVGEVENGGFIQYLENSAGDDFYGAFTSAHKIKCDELINILMRIESIFPGCRVPEDQDLREMAIESLVHQLGEDDPFNKLTSEFWSIQVILDEKMDKYLIDNDCV